MRELFPGFYKRTDEELSKCWQEGIFVFDTNMLLNVYRYAPQTRDRYFEILEILKKENRLWIPYQAAYEYQDRRLDVIRGQLEPYTKVSSILQTTWQQLDSSLEPYKSKHGIIDTTDLADQLTNAIKSAKNTVTHGNDKYRKYKQENDALKRRDRLLEKLEELFQGNIGSPYTSRRLEELYRQAQLRIELRIPPGWEDEGKHNFKAYGDIVLWFQLIDYAQTQKKPIIFVTDDGKKDWWIQDTKGNPIKPLPALVQEIYVEAGILFHMYLGYEFLEQAEHFLKLEKKPDIVEEAKEITEQNTIELNQRKYLGGLASRGYHAETAVYEWIKQVNQEVKLIKSPFDYGVDFILIETDGANTGIEVKYKKNPFLTKDVKIIIENITSRKGAVYNKIMLILVCENIDNAAQTLVSLRELSPIPPNLTISVGYLDGENHFRSFGTFLE